MGGQKGAGGMLSVGPSLHRCVAQRFPVGREVSALVLLTCEVGGGGSGLWCFGENPIKHDLYLFIAVDFKS